MRVFLAIRLIGISIYLFIVFVLLSIIKFNASFDNKKKIMHFLACTSIHSGIRLKYIKLFTLLNIVFWIHLQIFISVLPRLNSLDSLWLAFPKYEYFLRLYLSSYYVLLRILEYWVPYIKCIVYIILSIEVKNLF